VIALFPLKKNPAKKTLFKIPEEFELTKQESIKQQQ
jgi:hypothetical protein